MHALKSPVSKPPLAYYLKNPQGPRACNRASQPDWQAHTYTRTQTTTHRHSQKKGSPSARLLAHTHMPSVHARNGTMMRKRQLGGRQPEERQAAIPPPPSSSSSSPQLQNNGNPKNPFSNNNNNNNALAAAISFFLITCLLGAHSASAQSVVYPFTVGATKCYSCGFGNFSNRSGAEYCEACPKGSYNALNESASCQPCKNKTYAPNFGMTSCLVCETADYPGASTCPPPPVITEYFGAYLPMCSVSMCMPICSVSV